MEETTHLKNEIDRLNKIINILVDQVGILKAENTHYLNVINENNAGSTIVGKVIGSPNDGSTIAGKVIGSPNDESTVAVKVIGTPHIGSTIDEKGIGIPHIGSAIAGKVIGSPNDGSTVAGKVIGTPHIGSTIDEKGIGIPHIGSAIAGKVIGSPNDGNTIAGKGNALITINATSEFKLARALLKYYPVSIKRVALESIARQLLHLYNNGRTHRIELRNISGLSKPGFAKAIPKLVRRGMVKKVSYQEYEIAQFSAGIIANIFPG